MPLQIAIDSNSSHTLLQFFVSFNFSCKAIYLPRNLSILMHPLSYLGYFILLLNHPLYFNISILYSMCAPSLYPPSLYCPWVFYAYLSTCCSTVRSSSSSEGEVAKSLPVSLACTLVMTSNALWHVCTIVNLLLALVNVSGKSSRGFKCWHTVHSSLVLAPLHREGCQEWSCWPSFLCHPAGRQRCLHWGGFDPRAESFPPADLQ